MPCFSKEEKESGTQNLQLWHWPSGKFWTQLGNIWFVGIQRKQEPQSLQQDLLGVRYQMTHTFSHGVIGFVDDCSKLAYKLMSTKHTTIQYYCIILINRLIGEMMVGPRGDSALSDQMYTRTGSNSKRQLWWVPEELALITLYSTLLWINSLDGTYSVFKWCKC